MVAYYATAFVVCGFHTMSEALAAVQMMDFLGDKHFDVMDYLSEWMTKIRDPNAHKGALLGQDRNPYDFALHFQIWFNQVTKKNYMQRPTPYLNLANMQQCSEKAPSQEMSQ